MDGTHTPGDGLSMKMPFIIIFIILMSFMTCVGVVTADKSSPIVTPSSKVTILGEQLMRNYTEALTGNRSAPPGWLGFDWGRGIASVGETYIGTTGMTVFLILAFSVPFLASWIITQNIVVTGIIGGFLGIFIIPRLPAQMQLIAVALVVLSIVAVIYSLLKERI